MKRTVRPLSATAAATTLGLWLIHTPLAQAQTASGPATAEAAGSQEPLQVVEVTGTLIRTTDRTTFNQVQVITAADIAASGAVTVSDYLRDLSANAASSWADDFAYGAWGGSGIALHGLSEKYTLVLVDGVRVAPYGFPSNGSDSFFDLNSLPLNLIDRIEVVKTGAVSQYGSDAIGGVINIITRKDYRGLEADTSYGLATSGGEPTRKLSLLGGVGDLTQDHYNLTASASYFLQGGYTLADRANTRSQDYTSLPNGALLKAADYWEPNGVGNGGAALAGCPSGSNSVNAGLLLSGPGTGTACAVNTANGTSLHPHEERFSASVHLTVRLSDDIDAFGQLWDSRNITTGNDQPYSNQGYTGIGDSTSLYKYNPLTGGISQLSNLVPATNPYNPYGAPTPLTYTFLGQPVLLTVRSNFYRALGGLEGSFGAGNLGEWDWKASVSHSQSTVDNYESGLESVSGLTNILDNGVFDFSDPAATPDGLAGLYVNDSNQAISKLDTVDVSASTSNLFQLPAGNVGLGVGAQFLRESDVATDYALQSTALATPYYLQAIDGQRNVAAVYYQINIPLISTLAFSQSSRYDHYSDFGSAFSPRYALSYKPVTGLTTYASYSRGFRAPTLAETSQQNSSGVQTAVDPNSPTEPTTALNYTVLVGGNTHLRPEHTQNYNLGAQWDPTPATSLGLDLYRIEIKDVIGTPNIQALIDTNDPDIVVRNPNGTIAYVNFDYQNLNSLMTDGLELTARQGVTTSAGTFTVSGDWAYVRRFTQISDGVAIDFAGNDNAIDTPYGASFPRWKGTTTLDWSWHSVDTSVAYQYTGPYAETIMGGHVSSFGQVNLGASYSGFTNLTIYGRINNVLDRLPPYDPLFLQFPSQTPYDPSLYNDQGRYVEVGVRYRFL